MSITCFFVFRSKKDAHSLEYAAELAARHNLGLRVVCALPDLSSSYVNVAPEFGMAMTSIVPQSLIDDQKAMIEKTRSACAHIIGQSSLSQDKVDFISKQGFLSNIASEEAVLADMCVVPAEASTAGSPFSNVFLHILTECRLPIIVANTKPIVSGPVIIAWDGSEPASRAVRYHLPLLQRGSDVIIVHAPDKLKESLKTDIRSPAALERWLMEKDIKSRVLDIRGSVGQGLLSTASAVGASTIVSGAYGHSRLGEYLFGGVTRTLLNAPDAPALALCH